MVLVYSGPDLSHSNARNEYIELYYSNKNKTKMLSFLFITFNEGTASKFEIKIK